MYLKPNHSYYRGTEQCAARAPFLLLLQPKQASISATCAANNTFAVVRRVALRQCGHFMMGRVNLCGHWRTVSGAYGSDGLPMDIDTLPRDAVPLPGTLYDAWNKGRGWNSCGNEAPAMRAWACEQFKI